MTLVDEFQDRLSRLLGDNVTVGVHEGMFRGFYEMTACMDLPFPHSFKRVDWVMVAEDFDYTDDELVAKFVKPILSVLK